MGFQLLQHNGNNAFVILPGGNGISDLVEQADAAELLFQVARALADAFLQLFIGMMQRASRSWICASIWLNPSIDFRVRRRIPSRPEQRNFSGSKQLSPFGPGEKWAVKSRVAAGMPA